MSSALLPPATTDVESNLAETTEIIRETLVPLCDLLDSNRCPTDLLPWLAWSMSVDRWEPEWKEDTKRKVIADSYRGHKRKGTIAALRQVVEPFGYLIKVTEWWRENGTPGTFRLEIGTSENGIDAKTYYEMERLISDVKPVSRHLIGLNIILEVSGEMFTGGIAHIGDTITVYQE